MLIQNEKDVCIGDFGICYIDLEGDAKRATKIGERVGSHHFAAPEQTSLPPNFSHKSDIFSLGRILYFLVTGVYEFVPNDYTPITVRLSMKEAHPIDSFIQKLISFNPKSRPDSVEEVIQKIDDLLGIDKEESSFELSKMQERIMKYIASYSPKQANLKDILDHLSNFNGIERKPHSILDLSFSTPTWSKFVDMVENSLNQLEEAKLLDFENGEYHIH